MVLDRTVEDILNMIGHTGSKIRFPDYVEPFCRQSFHIQELIAVCWDLDYTVTPFEPHPVSTVKDGSQSHVIKFPEGNETRMMRTLTSCDGVLTGLSKNNTPHAVAWDSESQMIYNPTGEIELLGTFAIQSFWAVVRK